MRRRLAIALVASLLSAGSAVAEDVLVLKNGREARGKILEDTDTGVKLDIGGGTLFYPRAQISEVRRGAAETPVKTAPKAPQPVDARDEHSLLYDDGRRVGTRACRVARTSSGWRFDEEIVFL